MKKLLLMAAVAVMTAVGVNAQNAGSTGNAGNTQNTRNVQNAQNTGNTQNAQNTRNAQSAQGELFVPRPLTQPNHSVSVDLLGLHYAYELPVGHSTSIIGRAGVNFGVAWSGKSGGAWRTGAAIPYGDYWMVAPTVEVEPRWYYGLNRRAVKGRGTTGNQGSFLSLRVANTFRGYVSDAYEKDADVGSTTFSPTWGLRRVWGRHWMFEFTTGVRFGFVHANRWYGDNRLWGGDDSLLEHLDVGVRFGYSF